MSNVIEVGRGIQVNWSRALGARGPEFIVTSTTGYRAVLPECSCERTPCLKRGCDTHLHCHYGYHQNRVEAFALAVAKTYGSAKRRETSIGSRPMHNISPKRWKEIGGVFA